MNRYLIAIAVSCMLLGGIASAQQPAAAINPVKSATAAGPKYDSKLPIEISSDTLEVLQHENKAIFKGNVLAVQGQMRLKSDVMVVHYKQKDDKPAAGAEPKPVPKPPATPGGDQGEMGAITHIDVEGNVLVATPEESAKGDKGDYDVATHTIHLFGDNVILTRDKNILRGTALEYNLETGRSVLTNNGDVVGKSGTGRVRGVFVPNDTPKPGAPKAAAKPAVKLADPAATSLPTSSPATP